MNPSPGAVESAPDPVSATDPLALELLRNRKPFLWANPRWQPVAGCPADLPWSRKDIEAAEARWQRCAPLLQMLFPELESSGGIIESPLVEVTSLAAKLLPGGGRLLLKADHDLPVAGSIKARGGLYAVLCYAERLALENGILRDANDDYRKLAGPEARALFSGYTLTTASTGNLGLSIGIGGTALGFNTAVHMSVEAREWKKERLRKRGVQVIEHASDYTAACVVASREAETNPRMHYIDDENSVELFLGYSCAVPRMKRQLEELSVTVDADHPLFLHLPCGVGGGPGGIAFAARMEYGDFAHSFFVEPLEAPCMLLGMLTGRHSEISIYSIGLGLKTDADGLAVSTPSRFIGQLMEPLLSGCCTMADEMMYRYLLDLHTDEGIEVEPSATAGFGVIPLLLQSERGRAWQKSQNLDAAAMRNATHIVWSTGGSFVPPEQHETYRALARKLIAE